MKKILLTTIFILAISSFAQEKRNFVYAKKAFPDETLYNEIKANYPSFTYNPERKNGKGEYKKSYSQMHDGHLWLIPIGPLDAWGVVLKDSSSIIVYHVEPGGPADLAGLKKYDEIIGVHPSSFTPPPNAKISSTERARLKNMKPTFSQPLNTSDAVGNEGPVKELGEALDIAQSRGSITLNIARSAPSNDKNRSSSAKPQTKSGFVNFKIEKIGTFARNAPTRCRKTEIFAREMTDESIISYSDSKPKFTNRNSSALLGLSLLMRNDPKLIEHITEYIILNIPSHEIVTPLTFSSSSSSKATLPTDNDAYLNPATVKNIIQSSNDKNKFASSEMYISSAVHTSSWQNAFRLLFYVEYFWATGDTAVVPIIQALAYSVGEQHQNPFGGSGHHIHGIGNYWELTFGPSGAINIAAMRAAELAGFKVDKSAYERYWLSMSGTIFNQVNKKNNDYSFSINDDRFYGVEYFARVWSGTKPSLGESSFNTAAAILALGTVENIGVSQKLNKKLVEHLAAVPWAHSVTHASYSLGRFFSQLCLPGFDFPGFSKTFQYEKSWLILSRFPDKTRTFFYPKRARGGWGGDEYCDVACTVKFMNNVLLNGHRRNLACQGGKQQNYLSKVNPQKTRNYMREYHNFYAAHLLNVAKTYWSHKNYIVAHDALKKILDNYRETPSAKIANSFLKQIQSAVGARLAFDLKEREINRYIYFLNKEHEQHDSIGSYTNGVRVDGLKWIAEKYKDHPTTANRIKKATDIKWDRSSYDMQKLLDETKYNPRNSNRK